MKAKINMSKNIVALSALSILISGCAVGNQSSKMQADTINTIRATPEPATVMPITKTSGAWLLGQSVIITPPASPLLDLPISFFSSHRNSLSDIAAYITLETHLVVDVSEVTQITGQPMAGGMPGGAPGMLAGGGGMPGGMAAAMPPMPGGVPGIGGASAQQQPAQSMQSMIVNYEGKVSGLLDVIANKSGVWWKVVDGRVIFYRTESKTFYLPAIARKSTGNSTISNSSGSPAVGASAGGASAGGGATGGTSSATISSDYNVDFWADVVATAKAVGGTAIIATNPSSGSITVTGTPANVRAVASWVKSLNDQLSQQVSITVHMYTVKITKGETYNWDPSVVFKKTAGSFGYNLTPGTPFSPTGGATPVTIAASVLATATGATAQYSGSQAAFQALSTLGDVNETLSQSIVTLNGQPAPLQVANQQGYLASSTSMQTANVGSSSTLTPGTVTTGFTATFLPKIVNGKILLYMTITNSALIGITSISSAGSSMQNTNVDSNTFQQSVSLTPGDALMLTGLQKSRGSNSSSGVGSPGNFLLGGGVNNDTSKSMIAIVVSAKVI